MDDYKRTLYMLAQAELRRNASYDDVLSICCNLESTLIHEGHEHSLRDAREHFPEFHDLYDGLSWGFTWNDDGTFSVESDEVSRGGYWWEKRWAEPRMRALDVLLRD